MMLLKKTGKKYGGMEKNVFKAVQAFANSEGGTVLVGIDNGKKVLGLENDYELIGEGCGADEFEQQLIDQLASTFSRGTKIFQYVSIKIIPYENKQICVIKVKPSDVAFIRKENGQDKFFVRHGTTSKPYTANEFLDYWPVHLKTLKL